MNKAQKAQEDWVDRFRAAGGKLVEYACPDCQGTNYSPKPKGKDIYSTAVCCPHCAKMHYRVVNAKSRVDIVSRVSRVNIVPICS